MLVLSWLRRTVSSIAELTSRLNLNQDTEKAHLDIKEARQTDLIMEH